VCSQTNLSLDIFLKPAYRSYYLNIEKMENVQMITVLYNVLNLRCLVALVALVCIGCGSSGDKSKATSKDVSDTSSLAVALDSLTIELLGSDSVSVFDLLVADHIVNYISRGAGVFVKAIDSIANSTDHYWLYSVNDSMAQISADKYLTSDGDRVVWHYRRAGE